jgi:hypothetical protein
MQLELWNQSFFSAKQGRASSEELTRAHYPTTMVRACSTKAPEIRGNRANTKVQGRSRGLAGHCL